MQLNNISPELIKIYQDEIARRSSPATYKRKTASLSKFFNWAENQGHINSNPIQTSSTQGTVKTISKDYKEDNKKGVKPIWAFLSLGLGIIAVILALKNVKLPIPSKKSSAETQTAEEITLTPQTPVIASAWTVFAKLNLSDSSGSPVTQSQTITFSLYKDPENTVPVWTSGPIQQTPDTEGSIVIALDEVPTEVFFENEMLFLSGTAKDSSGNIQTLPQIPVSTANTASNLQGYYPSSQDGALENTIPVISPDGSLLLASESPSIEAVNGNLKIEGQALTLGTPTGSGGDITIAPSGETNVLSNINIQNANMTSGSSLISGYVGNNLSNYDLLNLSSGSTKSEKFSVDALGNTYIAGDATVEGELDIDDLSVNNITATGYMTDISKDTALTNLVTLTLDERNLPTESRNINTNYSTLVLKRYDGGKDAAALFVDEGNAIFDGMIKLGRFTSNPTQMPTGDVIDAGYVVYNTSDNKVYYYNGSAWTEMGAGAFSGSFADLTGGTNITAAMLVGTGASLGYTGSGTIDASSLIGATWASPGAIGSSTPNSGAFTSLSATTDITTPSILSSADLTINPTGGQVELADTIALNVGGLVDVAYNAFANSGEAPEEVVISADNDLYIGGDLEVDGTLYATSISGAYTNWTIGDDDGNTYDIVNTNTLRFTSSDGNILTDLTNGDDTDENLDLTVRLLGDAVAGEGLTGGADNVLIGADGDTTFTVGAGNGVTVNADDVAVNQDYAFSWTADHNYTFAATENIDISSDLAGTVNILNITGTPSASAGTTSGLYIDQADGAETNGLDTAITIDNSDTNLAIANGILFTSAGGGFTNYIDTPSSVFKVDGSGNLTTQDITVSGGNINTGDIALVVGDASTDSITFTTDSTGNAEVVLPNDSIGDAEIDWGAGAGQVNVVDVENGTDNILLETEIDASSELANLMDDEVGTGFLVFATSPTFTTDITTPSILSSADLTVNPTGGQVEFADTATLNVGGLNDVAYNAFANAADAPEEAAIAADNDLYIGGDLEVDGVIYGAVSGSAGSVKWNAITDPDGDLTLTMANNNTTLNWDPGADSAETNFSLTTQGEDSTGAGDEDQVLLALSQASNGQNVDEAADALLTLTNSDADDPVNSGVRFDAGGAGTDFTYGINFDAADIGTAEIVLENAEQIHNQTDGTITFEDGAGTDYATLSATSLAVAGDLTITGDDLFMTTNTANYFLMADGANYNPTSPADARTGLGLVAGGTGDIWVEKAGDTMTGPLLIDGGTDAIQLTIQGAVGQTANLQVWENSSGTDLAIINSSGNLQTPNIGVGIAPDTNAGIYITKTFTDTEASSYAIRSSITKSAVSTGAYYGESFTTILSATTGTQNNLYGLSAISKLSGAATLSASRGIFTRVENTGAGALTSARGIEIDTPLNSGGGTLGTNYGIYIANQAVGTTNYSILTNSGSIVFNEGGDSSTDLRVEGDTDANLLFVDASADNVGIGVNDPDTQLEIFHAGNQLKLSYDATDNTTFGVDTNGDLTIDASGTQTILSDDLKVSGGNINTGDIPLVLGDATTDTITLTTDGTGDGEIVLPNDSVATTEILDGTIREVDLMAVDASGDEECLTYEVTTGDFEWQACGSGGVTADSLDFTEFIDAMTVDDDTSIAAAAGKELTYNKVFTDATDENGFVMNFTASDTTSGATAQYGLYLNNVASTEGVDALIALNNADADDSVTDGIAFTAGGAGTDFLDGIDFSGANLNREIVLENGEAIIGQTADTITFEDDDGTDYATLTAALLTTTGDIMATGSNLSLGAAGVKLTGDGDGAITFLGLGDGFDEDLTLNLDDTENTGTFTSSTSLATINFSSINLQESGIGVVNLDEIDASSELAAIFDDETGTAGSIVFSTSPTFVTDITTPSILSAADLTINPTGGQVEFADTITLNVGGLVDVAYNAFADAADAPTATAIAADDDLFLGGDLETKGNIYLTGRNIYNTVGGVSTASLSLATDPTAENNYNTLSYGSWLVQNSTNDGIAALMVNQTKGGDIFTASASGTTLFTMTNVGNINMPRATTETASIELGTGRTDNGYAYIDFHGDATYTDYAFRLIRGNTGPNDNSTIYHRGTGNLVLFAQDSGADIILSPAAGGVGIGTTTPESLLEIEGGEATDSVLTLDADQGDDAPDTWHIKSVAADNTLSFTNGTSKLVHIDTSGFVVSNRGFVGYDSYFGEEFVKATATSTADAVQAQGDTGAWNVDENTSCEFESGVDYFGGQHRILNTADSSSCLTYLGETGANAHSIYDADYAPTVVIKANPNFTAAHQFWLGMSNSNAATSTDPATGIWFGNDSSGGANWYGKVCNSSTCSTTSSCGAVVEGNKALLVIKAASSSSVEFLIDTDVTDGISVTSCGTLTTNIPSDALGIFFMDSRGTSGSNLRLFMDYFRMWQDDPIIDSDSQSEDSVLAEYDPVSGADIAEVYPTIEEDEIEPGLIVSVVGGNLPFVQTTKIAMDDNALGIVSTSPKSSLTIGDNVSGVPSTKVALAGRVPVKMDPESKPVSVGDYITPSGKDGMGKKATNAGKVVGKALENWTPNSGKDTVMVFVNLDNYNPDIYLADSSGFDFEKVIDGIYETIDKISQTTVKKIGIFAEIASAGIRAGIIETKEFATGSFQAFQGTIDNLLVNNGLVSPIVQTDFISPLADSTDIVVKLGSEATASGKLSIQNILGEEVASIDSEGTAEFNNASISGELYAESISSPDLDAIEELLRQVQEDQVLLADASSWNTPTATDSGNIFDTISTSNLFVTEQAAVNSLSISQTISLGTDFVIQETGINTLSSPLSLQSLAMAPLEIMAGRVRIETNGDVTINANLFVAGKIESPEAEFKKLTTENFVIANPEATSSAIINGNEITTNASIGSALIPANTNEIIIINPNITDNTLVYVTPTSSTKNNVLYVKSKEEGRFTVGFNDILDVDVSFNWWIVQFGKEEAVPNESDV